MRVQSSRLGNPASAGKGGMEMRADDCLPNAKASEHIMDILLGESFGFKFRKYATILPKSGGVGFRAWQFASVAQLARNSRDVSCTHVTTCPRVAQRLFAKNCIQQGHML